MSGADPRWTEERKARLRELWWARGPSGKKHPTSAIGRELGVSKNAVVGKAWRMGLFRVYPLGPRKTPTAKRRPGTWTEELKARLLQLRSEKHSARQIGLMLGVTEGAVFRQLSRTRVQASIATLGLADVAMRLRGRS